MPETILRWSSICPDGAQAHVALVNAALVRTGTMHRHDFYECFLVESGKGWHLVGDRRVPLITGELWWVRPEHRHGFSTGKQSPLHFTNVALAAEIVSQVQRVLPRECAAWRGEEPVPLLLRPEQRERFKELASRLASSGKDALDAMSFLVELLQMVVRGGGSHEAHEPLPEWLRDALPLAVEPENLQAGVPQLVRLCGRAQEHVSRVFRKYLGMTPTAWLQQERIRYARRLLETTSRSVLEIGYECGFESASRFHRCFKEQSGMTPLHYRRRQVRVQGPLA